MEKQYEYAQKITAHVLDLFNDEDQDNFIDSKEFENEENLKYFFHALATVSPNYIFNKFTGGDKSNLEFNHVANQLCFEFCKKESE